MGKPKFPQLAKAARDSMTAEIERLRARVEELEAAGRDAWPTTVEIKNATLDRAAELMIDRGDYLGAEAIRKLKESGGA